MSDELEAKVQAARGRVLSQACCCEYAATFGTDVLMPARAELERDVDSLRDAALALGAARERARLRDAAERTFARGLCNAKHWLLVLPVSREKHAAFSVTPCDECTAEAVKGLGLRDPLTPEAPDAR